MPRGAERELVGFCASVARGSMPTPAQSLNHVVWVLSLREHANFRATRCEVTEARGDHLRVFLAFPSDVRAWSGDDRLHPPPVGLVADPDSPSMASGHIVKLASREDLGKGGWFPSREARVTFGPRRFLAFAGDDLAATRTATGAIPRVRVSVLLTR
jgi:hypothetical protein